MAEKSYAIIKDSIVINTAIFDDPSVSMLNYFRELYLANDIIECSQYVIPGFTWDGEDFIEQQPYPSWIYNSEIKKWIPPVEYPKDGKIYTWNEETTSWIED
jgi:hypothetical protein